nr:ribonuclease H-like domain-containing protein [Tanacetum cinerariifolium]
MVDPTSDPVDLSVAADPRVNLTPNSIGSAYPGMTEWTGINTGLKQTELAGSAGDLYVGPAMESQKAWLLIHNFKPETIRTVLNLVLSRNWLIHQLDVKNAFLNDDLSETVYMSQPSGFADARFPHHVCQL